ncbi:hypothetical protein IWZ00DRAFT_335584 [Phyllosticta capitalensis]|uniref:uncharacterized protein n=1 Tax=Phyllosticta capitalensis TaxID=121624 RepID=UPI00312CFE4F
MGFEEIVFFNLKPENGTCEVDADIAGIGVVTSFFTLALVTTLASIYGAILDGVIGEETVLPDFINRMLQRKTGSVLRYKFHRDVLQKVMISLADQQVMTGFALIVCGYLRAAHDGIPSWDPYPDGSYRSKLRDAHFDLIVFLSCLATSSHLACVLVLKSYFKRNKIIMTVRITLIVIFTILLAVTVGLSPPLSFGYRIVYDTYELKLTKTVSLSVLVMYLAILSFMVAIFVEEIHEKWKSTLHNLGSRIPPQYRPMWIQSFSAWCFSVLPTVQFISQLVYFTFSLILSAAQKFAEPPTDGEWPLCGLDSVSANKWGFGQTVPIFFLASPLFTWISEYHEIKHEKYHGVVDGEDFSSTVQIQSPIRPSSPLSEAHSLPVYRTSHNPKLDGSPTDDWHRQRMTRASSVSSLTRTSVDMAVQEMPDSESVSRIQSAQHPSAHQTPVVNTASFHGQNPIVADYLWIPQTDRD